MSDRPLYAVIMAGGAGTRFWPLSRRSFPKQFLPLLNGRSLLTETAARLGELVPWQRVIVVVTDGQQRLASEALPYLLSENLLVEPLGLNTAPCLALASAHIVMQCPDAIVAALPADHCITPAESFRHVLRAAAQLARQEEEVVTMGVTPTWAATGYGYLESGDDVRTVEGCASRRLVAFHEKPSAERAAAFLATGRHFWNAGIFVFPAARALKLLEQHVPGTRLIVSATRSGIGGPQSDASLRTAYRGLSAVSFDTGVMEKHGTGYLVEAAFEWSDVGSWDSMAEMWTDRAGNKVAGEVVSVEARDCAVYSPHRLAALVGVEGIVVVDSGDALLVCRKGQTQLVREVVQKLREQARDELL